MALMDVIDGYGGAFYIPPGELEAAKLLKELGIEFTAVDVLNLLKNEERLRVVTKKLKMKAFW